MGNLNSCPNCGRKAQKALSSNWFPIHTCKKCGKRYCNECGKGIKCPSCGSSEYSDYDKVYA